MQRHRHVCGDAVDLRRDHDLSRDHHLPGSADLSGHHNLLWDAVMRELGDVCRRVHLSAHRILHRRKHLSGDVQLSWSADMRGDSQLHRDSKLSHRCHV